MQNDKVDLLQNCISAGVHAALESFGTEELRQMVVGPYLEMQRELAASLRLAA